MLLNNIEVNILASIELIDAYNKQYPENFINENVIYCIHNKINGKNYVGQTSNFKRRYSECIIGHFKCYNDFINGNPIRGKYLYNSWKKYGFESFIVYIIDVCSNREEMNDRETYWIKTLHTCVKDPDCFGYNLTWGADDLGNLNSPEAKLKARKTTFERYGVETFANARTPEAQEKRIQTNISRYGSGSAGSKEKRIENFKNTMLIKYGHIMGKCLTPENQVKAIFNNNLSRLFNSISNIISKSVEPVINFNQYFYLALKSYKRLGDMKKHLYKIINMLSDLTTDYRWTTELNSIFGKSKQKLEIEFNQLLETKKKNNIEKMKTEEWGEMSSAKLILRHINKVIDNNMDLTWKDYSSLVFNRTKSYDAKIHLNKIIDHLITLKSLSGWTPELERIFGNLTEKDKL